MCVCVSLSLNAVLPSIPQCWISIREDHHILHTGWDIECMQDGGWRRGENTDQPVCVCVHHYAHLCCKCSSCEFLACLTALH